MTRVVRIACRLVASSLLALPLAAQAQQPMPQLPPGMDSAPTLEGTNYLGLAVTNLHHRSIGRGNETANTRSATLIGGRYISRHFKVEGRIGAGYIKDKPKPAIDRTAEYDDDNPRPRREMEVGLDYFASWYFGAYHQWTDYSSVYGQFGFSYVQGNRRGGPSSRYNSVDDDFLATSFSPSYLVGVDVDFFMGTRLFVEAGRLHRDAETGIRTYQYVGGLRYQF